MGVAGELRRSFFAQRAQPRGRTGHESGSSQVKSSKSGGGSSNNNRPRSRRGERPEVDDVARASYRGRSNRASSRSRRTPSTARWVVKAVPSCSSAPAEAEPAAPAEACEPTAPQESGLEAGPGCQAAEEPAAEEVSETHEAGKAPRQRNLKHNKVLNGLGPEGPEQFDLAACDTDDNEEFFPSRADSDTTDG
ncbi:unnamed protein product [Cladocopium goreaui]|uniref:Uncharacterized protein n=1 Tax=Cladocopium goreaui TaxID=2562237 RepID=A0A9P1BP95_9DINO|nr:unnamed protein product [Cladocopium goreaui]